jgi:hypothetical protein
MKRKKFLYAVCYFSLFFAPLIFPGVIWICTNGVSKIHAKKAFLTHFVIISLFIIVYFISDYIEIKNQKISLFNVDILIQFLTCLVMGIYFFTWNIINGIKSLRKS